MEDLLSKTTETMHCVRIPVEDLRKLLEERAVLYKSVTQLQELNTRQLMEIRQMKGIEPLDEHGEMSADIKKRSEAAEALHTLEERGLVASDLDDIVHEVKADEASRINNEGMEAQVAYLLEELGFEDVCKLFL